VEAVPSVARRREDLPRALPAGQVTLLLDSCDRATPTGRRDYAIYGAPRTMLPARPDGSGSD
jgi:integrase